MSTIKKILLTISLISALLLSSGCISYMAPSHQTLLNKLDDLGFHDYYALMLPGELKLRLKEKGYILLDEYNDQKLYRNSNVKDKYIVISYRVKGYDDKVEYGWRIVAIDERIPNEWEGKKEYNN